MLYHFIVMISMHTVLYFSYKYMNYTHYIEKVVWLDRFCEKTSLYFHAKRP